VSVSCEHDNKYSGTAEGGEFPDQLKNYQLLKLGSSVESLGYLFN